MPESTAHNARGSEGQPAYPPVTLMLRRSEYDLLRTVLWGAGMAYQAVDGGVNDGVLRMGDLPPDFADLMRAISAAGA